MDRMKSCADLTEKMSIQQVISKPKMDYMKKCYFENNEEEVLYNIGPDASLLGEYIEKNPVDKSTLCRHEFAEHEVPNVGGKLISSLMVLIFFCVPEMKRCLRRKYFTKIAE